MNEDIIKSSSQEIAPTAPTETALTATTATSAIATGVPSGGGFVTVEIDVAYNIKFGTSAVGAPAAHYAFTSGGRRFWTDQTHFRITPAANGYASSWKSSR